MTKKTYVFIKPVHFGGLKFSLPKGSKIEIVEDKKERYAIVNGEKVERMKEFDLCIKNGFILPFEEGKEVDSTIKTMKRKTDKAKKMTVEKSDTDLMKEVIDISHTKNENIKEKKQNEINENKQEENTKTERTARGMKIVQSDAKTIGGSTEINNDDISSLVNGDDAKVVATINKKEETSTNETVAKKTTTVAKKTTKSATTKAKSKEVTKESKAKAKAMSDEVKARLAARKKQAQEGHEKTVAQENKQ
jgi:hypothetical protein